MKIKVLLAMYLAWVILALLAVILIFAAVSAFFKNTSFNDLKTDIDKYEETVKRGTRETTAPRKTTPDYIDALKDRLDHLPVLDRYRHNPFAGSPVVNYPLIQFVKDQTHEVKIKGVRFTEVLSGGDPYVRVTLAWQPEDETGTVTFKALEPGEVKERPVVVLTEDNIEYHFELSVLKEALATSPLPPTNVTVQAHAKWEVGGQTEPPMVLISFLPDNGAATTQEGIGTTNAANIYRKLSGAGDDEYVLLQQIQPATSDELQGMATAFFHAEEEPVEEAPPAPEPTETGEPPAPEAAPEPAPATAAVRPAEAGTANALQLPEGAFAYLDASVDDGESYVYKIETLNVQPGLKAGACKKPYVSFPVLVPSLVEFDVRSVTNGLATLMLSRLDPDTGMRVSSKFVVAPGMKIGGKVSVKQALTGQGRVGYKDVDFSTNCILVEALSSFGDIKYEAVRVLKIGAARGSDVFVVRRLVPDATILYLMPRGSLRLKSKLGQVLIPEEIRVGPRSSRAMRGPRGQP